MAAVGVHTVSGKSGPRRFRYVPCRVEDCYYGLDPHYEVWDGPADGERIGMVLHGYSWWAISQTEGAPNWRSGFRTRTDAAFALLDAP